MINNKMSRKIGAMHDMFGTVKDVCNNCCHLLGEKGGYRKCEIYGVSHSAATDWAISWQACGMFNVLNTKYANIYKSLPHNRPKEEEIEGQVRFDL